VCVCLCVFFPFSFFQNYFFIPFWFSSCARSFVLCELLR
jgi:hypothetical protein